jgi:EAL and modified HD-GYP domain-containing signal transduction protein
LENAWLTFGLPTLVGSKRAFVNFTRQLLVTGYGSTLPAKSTVIELLETIEPDPDVVAACRKLKEQGYMLAADDYVHRPGLEPLIELADIVKVAFRDSDPEEQAANVRRIAGDRPKLLAEQVETHAEYKQALDLGFDYFQGYFFCKPEVLSDRALTASQMSYLKLFQAVNRPELSIDELEAAISNDVALTHRFLKYLGSAMFSWRAPISSVRQGLVLLGKEPTQRWVSLIALSEMGGGKPQEVLVNAAVRAKCCETLARDAGLPTRESELFLLGALSLIDAMLDQPMEEVLKKLPISDDLKSALTGQSNELSSVLDFVRGYERGDWASCGALAPQLGVQDDRAPNLYRDAITWANEVLGN